MNVFAWGATAAFRMAALLACLLLALQLQTYAQSNDLRKVSLKPKVYYLSEFMDALNAQATDYGFSEALPPGLPEPRFFASADNEPMNLVLDRILGANGLQWRMVKKSIIISIDTAAGKPKTYDTVQVTHPKKYSTGYHEQPVDTPTGAVDLVKRSVLDETESTGLIHRLENNTSGLLINHGGQGNGMALPPGVGIWGPSTIYSNSSVQYVLGKAFYSGDLRNINPEDIGNVTIEKDAASTGLYGVLAGNGVIVFTPKRGTSPTPLLEYSSSITWQGRPDLNAIHQISAGDEVAFERTNYSLGNYWLGTASHPAPVPPVVYLLNSGANSVIDGLAGQDSRRQMSKYLYGNSCIVREHIDVSGATPHQNYYLGFGYDHQPSTLVASNYDRYTFRMNNSFTPGSKWNIDADAGFTLSVQSNGNNPGAAYRSLHGGRGYPAYQLLVGRNGHALPVFTDYNRDFDRQLSQDGYLNEYFRPVADIRQEQNTVQTTDYTASVGVDYQPRNWVDAETFFAAEYQAIQGKDAFSDSAYFVRDLQNTFAQRDNNGNISFPVPPGGIESVTKSDLITDQLRLQLNLHPKWNADHRLTALAGGELSGQVNTGYSFRYYGFDGNSSQVNSTLNFNIPYTSYLTGASSDIPNPQGIPRTTNHFLSGYMEAEYVDHRQLSVTMSLRQDAANLFGVRTNQRAIPLWSTGLGYRLDSMHGFYLPAVPLLRGRLSYGVSGNVGRQASAYTTGRYSNAGLTTSLPNVTILSPPNNDLRWEQVARWDAGLDFALRKDRLSGSIDYYLKSSSDLMGQAPMDPTLGLIPSAGNPAYFYGNVAAMKGHGFDLRLTAISRPGKKTRLTTVFLLSQNVTKVTKYFMPTAAGNAYLNPTVVNPVPGRPLYAVYSFPWKGLDPSNGDPRSLYNGKASTAWDTIWANTTVAGMDCKGSAEPVWFGSLRQSIEWKQWTLTALLSFKLDYYFRRPSINYGNLLNLWIGNSDYARRWLRPGDERRTNVPSALYNPDPARDNIYTYSTALVDRADNIRLEDVRLSRDLQFRKGRKVAGMDRLTIYADAANLGVIWKANKDGIDPYFVNTPRDTRRWSVGFRGTF
ncbi:MAG TPA: hypothetical protein VG101_10185 [Puia sp.]|jgi:hypothetical protein|nr:hypothetical protein [Puia sp.]